MSFGDKISPELNDRLAWFWFINFLSWLSTENSYSSQECIRAARIAIRIARDPSEDES